MKAECETKHKLLQTAMELMWESSYGSVSVDHICKRAGVNKGSFYYFFPSKADLTVAAMEEHWQEKKPNMDRVFSPQSPVARRLEDIAAYMLAHQEAKQKEFGKICGCPHISLGSELGTQEEKIRAKTEEIIDRSSRYWESLVRDAQNEGLVDETLDPKALSRDIYAYVLGLIMQARLTNSLEPLHSVQGGVMRLLGMKSSPALA